MNPSAPNPDSGLRGLLNRIKPHAVPLVILSLLWLTITIVNMPGTGQWLTSWDNLHPEFNIPLNLKRALVGIWQEFQGLGLVGGHGYSATIPHSILVGLLSLLLPINLIRTSVIFLMLLVGSIGTYALAHTFLIRGKDPVHAKARYPALVAGVIAMLNLATVQNFYIPLEAFVIQFGLLPWLLLSLWRLLERPTKGTFIVFLLVNIAIVPIGFIPPLFVVTMLCVGVTILAWFLMQPNRSCFLLTMKIIIGIICIHAFWLLPVAYFSATHQSVYLAAYNNLSSTEHFIHMNQKYGTLAHVPIMRSFLFESLDVTDTGGTTPIFSPWIAHLQNPWIVGTGYSFFALALFGWIVAITRARTSYKMFSVAILTVILFTLLATDTVPFSWVSLFLQKVSPTFFQSFRIAFTKLSLAYALMVSLLIGLGLEQLFRWVKQSVWQTLGTGIAILFLMIFSFPSFRGHFLYERTKQTIPSSYLNLFTFFKQPSTQGRILNLPQGWNWGWTPYAWGYSGSGFLWYGIENPIMDRAFDVWSAQNENYYWELVYALYSKQYEHFDALLGKYDVSWVLFDPSVIPYQQSRAIFSTLDVASYLSSSSRLELFKTFDHLKLYRVTAKPSESFVSVETNLPNILPRYGWTENDTSYQQYGSYISDPAMSPDVWYPFRSLFTKRSAQEREFYIQKTDDGYLLNGTAPSHDVAISLSISAPSLRKVERYVPGIIALSRNDGLLTARAFALYPTTNGTTTKVALGSPVRIAAPHSQEPYHIIINGIKIENPIDLTASEERLVHTSFITQRINTIEIANNRGKILSTLHAPVLVEQTFAYTSIQPPQILIPYGESSLSYDSSTDPSFYDHRSHDCIQPASSTQKVEVDPIGRYLVFSSDHEAKQCFDIILPRLPHDSGYLVEIQTKNISGKPLTFVVINQQTRKNDMEVALPKTKDNTTSFFIIPPMQTDGLGYALKFLNEAEYGEPSNNHLYSMRVTPIPYRWLTNMTMTSVSYPMLNDSNQIPDVFSIDHPNPAYYKIALRSNEETNNESTLTLSQSYDPGWKAYEIKNSNFKLQNWLNTTFPFVFGKEMKEHVLINNWENGWKLEELRGLRNIAASQNSYELTNPRTNEATIVLFFTPQLLQWLGFALLPLPFLYALRPRN